MRHDLPNSHAAHREEQHHTPHTHNNDEPLKRSYERVIDGEDPLPEDSPNQALLDEPEELVPPSPVAESAPTATPAEADREVDQELAWQSGSSDAKYGSLKKEDTNTGKHAGGK